MKKIKLSDIEIKDIIYKYTHEPIGCAEIGKQYGVSREVIVRILKENNVTLTPAGQKYRGGKKEASKRFYQKNKEKLQVYYQEWLSNTDITHRQEKIKEWREKNREKLREKNRINYAKRRQDAKNNNSTHLTLESVREIRRNGKHIKLKYHDVLLSKEYLQSIIDVYGKEYLLDYIDDVLYVLRKSSPKLPDIETNETLYGIQKHINNINPLDENGNILNGRINSYGNMLLKSHFKSYWRSNYKKRKSPYDSWLNDTQMRLILKYRMGINNSGEVFDISLRQMIKGISATRTSISFFKPLLASYLYQRYLGDTETPVVFDPCCGFGGRMVGFKLTYPNGTYIGCEPNKETYLELVSLAQNFDNIKLYNCKFEDFIIDFDYNLALTSIPYFDLEEYSRVVEYKNFTDWCDKFIKPLIDLDNLVVNMSSELCGKLGLNEFLDCYLINNKNHFKNSQNHEVILQINY